MTNLRSHIDPDQSSAQANPTPLKTGKNQHEVRCSICGDAFYVSESVFLFAKEGIEAGLDNPFKCDDCEEEYDQLSY